MNVHMLVISTLIVMMVCTEKGYIDVICKNEIMIINMIILIIITTIIIMIIVII